MAIIDTCRLRLAPLRHEDAEEALALVGEPSVRRFLFDDQRLDAADVAQMILRSRSLQAERGAGGWTVRAHDTNHLAGMFWLWPFQNPHQLELAFALSARWRGRGYAMEAGDALLAHVRDELRWPGVHASTDIGNAASIRTLWRLDFKETGLGSGPAGPLRLFVREFAAEHAGQARWVPTAARLTA